MALEQDFILIILMHYLQVFLESILGFLYDFYFYLYYISIFSSISFFYIFARTSGVVFYSFTHAFFVISMLFGFLPGYFISAGTIDEIIYLLVYRGFDYELYYVYLVSLLLTPVSLIFGSFLAGRKFIYLRLRSFFGLRLFFSFVFIIIYAVLYFYWIPKVPLNEMIRGGGLDYAYDLRMIITHGYAELSPPFLMRYWRSVLQGFSIILFFIIFSLRFYRQKRLYDIFLLLYFLLVIYFLIFTIEKAAVVQFVIAAIVFYRMLDLNLDREWKDFFVLISGKGIAIILVFLASLELVYFFLSSGGGILDAFLRIFKQASSNYLQIELAREEGLLGLSGLNSKLLTSLGVKEAQDLSVLSSVILHSIGESGVEGTGGGMYSTNVFFIAGWWFVPLVFIYILSIGYIDKILTNTVIIRNDIIMKSVLIAFYCYFVFWITFVAFSSPLQIYSVDFILHPALIILAIFGLWFISFFNYE